MTITEAKAAMDAALLQVANAVHDAGLDSVTFADGTVFNTNGAETSGVQVVAPCVNGKGSVGH